MDLEETFDLEIHDDEAEKLLTVSSVVEEKKSKNRQQSLRSLMQFLGVFQRPLEYLEERLYKQK